MSGPNARGENRQQNFGRSERSLGSRIAIGSLLFLTSPLWLTVAGVEIASTFAYIWARDFWEWVTARDDDWDEFARECAAEAARADQERADKDGSQ